MAAGRSVASAQLSAIESVASEVVASATLVVETRGPGFTEITVEARQFLA